MAGVLALSVLAGAQASKQPADLSPRFSMEDTIHAYTLGAAYAGRREKTEGTLEPGKLANFILLGQDLFKIEPSEIDRTEVRSGQRKAPTKA